MDLPFIGRFESEDRILPRLAPTPLQLNETEREQLQQLVNRHRTPQQIGLRASIVLLADEGQNHL